MAQKVRLTRPELRRQRDALQRFDRYLPMLKLKQQQLQLTMRQVHEACSQAQDQLDAAQDAFGPYRAVLADAAGVAVEALAEPAEVKTTTDNIAGVKVPVFEALTFPEAAYSLFATPAWVDRALLDLRTISQRRVELEILRRQQELLERELTKIIQRVNLFEKVKIPEAQEAIRVIRIHLGDEMTAGVARAKIAKGKLAVKRHQSEAPEGPGGDA
jgi:V/A-type H+-transporting ATPase subunit D